MDTEGLVWAQPTNYWHIYDKDSRQTLCGKYAAFPGLLNNKTPVKEDDTWRENRDCKACCRKAGLL